MKLSTTTLILCAVLEAGVLIAVFFAGMYFAPVAASTPTAHDMSSMQSAMTDMQSGLTGKTGDEFDKAFLTEMILHHQGAVAMAEQVLATSQRPELRTLATAIITAQNGEITQMRSWQDTWFQK